MAEATIHPARWKAVCRRAVLAAVFGAFLLADTPAARAQATPEELRAQAAHAMGKGAFADAVPALSQLVEWFGTSTKEATIAEMETVYFNLGLCHLFLAQFDPAKDVFRTYLKKYRHYARAPMAALYLADSLRYSRDIKGATAAYLEALKTYAAKYTLDERTDLRVGLARCYLSEEQWAEAEPVLIETYRWAPDADRRNWAGSMLAISYLKQGELDKVYRMVPLLLQANSFASRSVAFNVAALERGDELFADEKYRDALWVYRLVYPHDTIGANARSQQERLQFRIELLKRMRNEARRLLRAQEAVSEIAAEVEALEKIPNYDNQLFFRIARSYLEIRRFREACELFYELYQNGPDTSKEECLYLSFVAASRIKPSDRAFARGHEYMKQFRDGAHYDTVSLTLGQLYAAHQNWPKVIEVLTEALAIRPKHEQIGECLFLLGYACFMEERLEESQKHLSRLIKEFPGNDREEEATYWLGMAFLFDRKYEEAQPHFQRVMNTWGEGLYAEDSTFRDATCEFALARYIECERRLLAFVQKYPQSKLLGEAYVMLGDISGTVGENDEAIRRYAEAIQHELNIELYNHACFRTAEMLKDAHRYDDLILFFERYIERNKPESNIPLALYYIGTAHWEKGDKARTLTHYLDAIHRYGRDRKELGIDLILEDWVGRTRNAPEEVAREGWSQIRQLLRTAATERAWGLMLRIERMLLFDPGVTETEKTALRNHLLRPESIDQASTGVLEYILQEAPKAGKPELARMAADEVLKTFPETDVALDARANLAQAAIAEGQVDEAIKHLNIIREVYAASDAAAEALMTLGQLYLDQKRTDEADAAYRDVLGAKTWRSFWPKALFQRGEVARSRGKWAEASAYYERIYILYGGSREWAGKAYLARADCLMRLAEPRKAVELLQAMLADPNLQGQDEVLAAGRAKLEDVQKRM